MDKKNLDKLICFILVGMILFIVLAIISIKSGPRYNEQLIDVISSSYDSMVNESENVEVDWNSVLQNEISTGKKNNPTHMTVTTNGKNYKIVGKIIVDKLNIEYPIIAETTDEYLKIAPTKICGPVINTVGNLCIAGHNYLNGRLFSNLNNLTNGDIVKLVDNNGNELEYVVYSKYTANENDTSCLSQDTEFQREVTLITCVNDTNDRLIVKCREVEKEIESEIKIENRLN